MKDKFLNLYKRAGSVREFRQAVSAQKAEQQAWLSKFNKAPKDFELEIKNANGQISKIESGLQAFHQKLSEDLINGIFEILDLAAERAREPIDLSDTRLVNAISLARNGNLSYEQANGIASQFVGQQNALRLLKSTFDVNNVHNNIETMIYDPEAMKSKAQEFVNHVVFQNGSPETFMRFMADIARLEGITDLPEIGNQAIIDGARKGAGLDPDESDEPKNK